MKLQLDQIAKKMINAGFSSSDVDKESFTNRIVEILGDKDLFNLISEEMQILEEERESSIPLSYEDYVGRYSQKEF